MAVIAVAGFGAAWTASTAAAATAAGIAVTAAAAALQAAAIAAAAIGASYLDAKFVYPALFGKDTPQNPAVLGLDTMTGDDGAPGHRAWGRSALVGGHCGFFENLETITNRQTSKKAGSGITLTKRTATVGLFWCHNLIQGIDTIYADQKTFWRRTPNSIYWSDYRCTVTTASSGTRLAITPTVSDTQDIGPIIFVVGDVVQVANMPTGPNGYWRVVASYGVGDTTYQFGRLELTPLDGQTPATGDPGSPAVPMEVRRIDGGIIDDQMVIFSAANMGLRVDDSGPAVGTTYGVRSHFHIPIETVLRPGMFVRFLGFSPGGMNGRWKILQSSRVLAPAPDAPFVELYFEPMDGQTPSVPTSGTTSNPARILIEGDEGFLEPSADQAIQHYLGTEDQGPDQDLEAVYGVGNAHGYRGIARSTIRDYNLSNFGDRVSQHSAVAKVNTRHTTHDVFRDVMLEHYDDDSSFDLTDLEPNVVIGYSRRGQQQGTTTLQPVAIAYGIEAQDVGGQWRLFKPAAAHLHVLAENELGAYRGDKPVAKFRHQRIQDRDLPRRLSLFYRDPLNDFARTPKLTRASHPSDQSGEDVTVDVDPLVMYPWDAQNAVNRLFLQALIGRDQGTITLPPSRMDILPNDRLTFTALNWNRELLTVVAGEIAHTTQIGGIEEGSISIEMDFTEAGGCRLVDDGAGALVGFPATVTPTTNSVDYDTGEILFAADDTIEDSGEIRYEFPNPWRMRVQSITAHRNRVFDLQLVAVAERFPVVGSPVQINDPAFQIVVRPAVLNSHVLDIAGVIEGFVQNPGVFFAATPLPGSEWRGAGVYSSTDNISFTLLDYIQHPTVMGTATDHLVASDEGVVDWSQTLTVQLDYGSLTDATLDQLGSGYGNNWALYGDEILGFMSAVLEDDGSTTLSGFVRGLRDTTAAIGTHVDDERFVLLTALGVDQISGQFHEFPLPTEVGRTVWVKIVPTGGALDDYDATQVTWQAENVRSFAPTSIVQGDLATYGYDIYGGSDHTYDATGFLTTDVVVRWFRRSRSIVTPFGAGAAAPMLEAFERYFIEVLQNNIVVRSEIIGGANTGSTMVHRTFRYTVAQQTADGLVSADEVVFRIRQIGAGGEGRMSRAAEISWTIP